MHKQEAHRQAELRGEKLSESQRAYQAGNKHNAHELSAEVWMYSIGLIIRNNYSASA